MTSYREHLSSHSGVGFMREDLMELVICKDIPGKHTGGSDCFCCPTVVDADLPLEQINEIVRKAEIKH